MRAATWARNLVFGLIVAFIGGGAASAQTVDPQVNVSPLKNKFTRKLGGGFELTADVVARFERQTASGASVPATTYHRLPVTYSAATVGNLAKNILKKGAAAGAVYFALEAIIAGAGWAIDELTGQVVAEPGSEPEPLSGTRWCMTSGGVTRCANGPEGALNILKIVFPVGRHLNVGGQPAVVIGPHEIHDPGRANQQGRYRVRYDATGGETWSYATFNKINYTPEDAVNANPSTDPVWATDWEIADAVGDKPDVANAIMHDPQTGAPYVTPELATAMDDLADAIADEHGGTPQHHGTPEPVDQQAPQPTPTDTPEFCTWASVVCDFIAWFKADDAGDNGWQSGWGNGSCPAAEQFDIEVVGSSGSASFDWQPVCDFATMIRPFFITVCLLVAATILAGLRGGAK
jgi:hypothetical protein